MTPRFISAFAWLLLTVGTALVTLAALRWGAIADRTMSRWEAEAVIAETLRPYGAESTTPRVTLDHD